MLAIIERESMKGHKSLMTLIQCSMKIKKSSNEEEESARGVMSRKFPRINVFIVHISKTITRDHGEDSSSA
jgi:hypothetical protein